MNTILVTGTNKGVGLEITRLLSNRGDRVIACCRRPLEATALSKLEGNIDIQEVSVGEDESVSQLASRLNGVAIDTIINNAGTMGPEAKRQSVLDMDFSGWADAFNINSMGPVRIMQALLPNLKMTESPKVMTVTSQMGALSLDMTSAHAYCSSKAALNKFMRLASIDLKPDGIAVGLVHPGWVRTDMGGPRAHLSPEESAAGCIEVTDTLSLDNTGGFWKWNGETHDW
ncbi:MAG: SDR family oxidoreductase [Candidatus Azotimanducaceae bacterium]